MKLNLFFPALLRVLFVFTVISCCNEEIIIQPTTLQNVIPLHFNNENELPVFAHPAKIKKEAYILGIHLECAEVKPHDFDVYELINGISFIHIYTVNNFNDDFPAGSMISDCFKIYPIRPKNPDYGEVLTSTKLIDRIHQDKGIIYNALLTLPDPGIHIFRIVVTLRDGEIIERITEPVELY